MTLLPSPFMQSLIDLAVVAGAEIMAIYATDFSAKAKGDLTPVTEADEAAEKIILAGLARIGGSVPVISEEAASAGKIPEVAEQVLPRRSARRHQGIHFQERRIHRQHRPRRAWRSGGGRRLCAGPQAHLLG